MDAMNDRATPSPSLPPPAPWRFLRARTKVIGGVCAGLAAATGIDVTLVRLAFVVAGLSGFGVFAYILLMIVVPMEDPAAGRYLRVAPPETAKWLKIALIVAAIAGVSSIGGWPLGIGARHDGPGFIVGMVLLVGGIAYLLSRRADTPAGVTTWAPPSASTGAPASGPVGTSATTGAASAAGQGTGSPWAMPAAGSAPIAGEPASAGSARPSPPPYTPNRVPADAVTSAALADDVDTTPTAVQGSVPIPRKRSTALTIARIFGWLAFAGAVVGLVAMIAAVRLDALSMRLPWVGLAIAIGALASLVATTTAAKSAGPILASMAVVLGAGVVGLGLVRWDRGVGERISTPATLDEVQANYDLAVGRRVVDLSKVELGATPLTLSIDQGVGQVDVVVPASATVVADVEVRLGETEVLGRQSSGADAQLNVTDTPANANGTVNVTVDLGIGQARVCRASAVTGGSRGCNGTTAYGMSGAGFVPRHLLGRG